MFALFAKKKSLSTKISSPLTEGKIKTNVKDNGMPTYAAPPPPPKPIIKEFLQQVSKFNEYDTVREILKQAEILKDCDKRTEAELLNVAVIKLQEMIKERYA